MNCAASSKPRFISSIILFLSLKVPSNPRYLWTQLSSVDSTSVDTDYEQFDPSTDPSVSLSTFRSEPRSFISSICNFSCLILLLFFLHFAVEAASPHLCLCCVHRLFAECLVIKIMHCLHHFESRFSALQNRNEPFDEAFRSSEPL